MALSSPSPATPPGWSRRGCLRTLILIAGTGIAAGAIAGIIVCLLVFIPLHDKPAFTSRGMIATLAISLIGSQLFLMIFGPTSKSLPDLFGRWKVKLFDITLTADKIGIRRVLGRHVDRRRVVDALEPAGARNQSDDDESARRLDRRHRHSPHWTLRDGADRCDGRPCVGAPFADLLHRTFLGAYAAHQGRIHRTVRRTRFCAGRGDRGDPARSCRGTHQ